MIAILIISHTEQRSSRTSPAYQRSASALPDEQIFKIGRVTTNLGIEVRTAIAQTTIANDLHHSLCQFVVVDGELVGPSAARLDGR